MKKQEFFDQAVYICFGSIFFTAYVLLITIGMNLPLFSSVQLLGAIYLFIAIWGTPLSLVFLTKQSYLWDTKSAATIFLSYIVAPIVVVFWLKKVIFGK